MKFIVLTSLLFCFSAFSAEPPETKVELSGAISATVDGQSVVMGEDFLAEITMVERKGDPNHALASIQAEGNYSKSLDDMKYTYHGKIVGAGRCLVSTDLVLNINVKSFKSLTNPSEKAHYITTLYFSSLAARDGSRSAQTMLSLTDSQDNLLQTQSVSLTSAPAAVLQQSCNQLYKEVVSTLKVNKIQTLN